MISFLFQHLVKGKACPRVRVLGSNVCVVTNGSHYIRVQGTETLDISNALQIVDALSALASNPRYFYVIRETGHASERAVLTPPKNEIE